MLLGGSLGDRYGRKRVFLLGLAGFTGASVAVRPGAERRGPHRRPRRCRAWAPRCSCPAAWPSSRRRSTPTTGRPRSARGRASAASPAPSARSSGGYLIDSVSWRAGLLHQPAARRWACWSPAVTSPRAGPTGAAAPRPRRRGDGLGRARARHLRADRGPPGHRAWRASSCSSLFVVVEARSPDADAPAGAVPATASSAGPTSPRSRCTPRSAARSSCSSSSCRSRSATRRSRRAPRCCPVTLLMVSLSSRAGALGAAHRAAPADDDRSASGVAAGLLLWTRVDVGATYVERRAPRRDRVRPRPGVHRRAADGDDHGVGRRGAPRRRVGREQRHRPPRRPPRRRHPPDRRRRSTSRRPRRRSTRPSNEAMVITRRPGAARRSGRLRHRPHGRRRRHAHAADGGRAAVRRPLPRARPMAA